MLNISYNQPMGQQLNCPIGQPPYVPQLPQFQHMQQAIPMLASFIVNMLSANLYSAGRIYVFNKASYNNWMSEGMTDLTELGCMILEIGRQRNIQINEHSIQQAADQAIAMYVSREIVTNDQLRAASNPESVNAAYQNVQQLNSYVQQLNISRAQGSGMSGGMGGGMGFPQHNPHSQQVYSRHTQQPTRVTQNLQSGISRGSTSLGTTNQNVQSSPVDQSRHFSRQFRQERNAPAPTQPMEPVIPKAVTKDDWKPSAAQYHRALFNPIFEQEIYTTDTAGNVIQLVEDLQEPYMDREKHRLVTVLGQSFHLNTKTREQLIGASVGQLTNVKQMDLHAATEDSVDAEEVRQKVVKHVYPNLLSDIFLEPAILSGRLHQLEQQSISAVEAYRCFAIIYKPHVTKENCNPILNSLSKYKTFSSLADAMRDTGGKMQERFSNTQDDEVRFDNQDAVLYINTLDVMLTEFINSFLKNNLSLGKIRIDSFVEDVGQLSDYLDTQMNARYSAAFKSFEFAIMDSLLRAPDEKTEKGLLDILRNSDDQLPCNFGFIPTSYSLTYLNVLSKELALENVSNEAVLIREQQSPLLFDIAESLFKQSEAFIVAPMYNLLITQDQRIFKIYKGFLSTNSYLIGQ